MQSPFEEATPRQGFSTRQGSWDYDRRFALVHAGRLAVRSAEAALGRVTGADAIAVRVAAIVKSH
jgi:hypothetical protein